MLNKTNEKWSLMQKITNDVDIQHSLVFNNMYNGLVHTNDPLISIRQ